MIRGMMVKVRHAYRSKWGAGRANRQPLVSLNRMAGEGIGTLVAVECVLLLALTYAIVWYYRSPDLTPWPIAAIVFLSWCVHERKRGDEPRTTSAIAACGGAFACSGSVSVSFDGGHSARHHLCRTLPVEKAIGRPCCGSSAESHRPVASSRTRSLTPTICSLRAWASRGGLHACAGARIVTGVGWNPIDHDLIAAAGARHTASPEKVSGLPRHVALADRPCRSEYVRTAEASWRAGGLDHQERMIRELVDDVAPRVSVLLMMHAIPPRDQG